VVLARFTEVESGKPDTRPELTKALTLARLTDAMLLIAKLDRLSRNAACLLTLQGSGAPFLTCGMRERLSISDNRERCPIAGMSGTDGATWVIEQIDDYLLERDGRLQLVVACKCAGQVGGNFSGR
jgi:hypothetical protein